MKDRYDGEIGYCRMLGHHVPFRYCRLLNGSIPCRSLPDCWHERIDVMGFLADHYTEAERDAILTPPPHKLTTLVDLIRKASERKSPD